MKLASVRSSGMWWVAALACLMAVAAIVPQLLRAQEQPAANRPQPHMQVMGRVNRGLRGQISDATKNSSSLELLAQFETEALAAKGSMPPLIAALPEADRPAKIADYKKEMIKLIRQAFDAEEAVLSGDNAKAQTALEAMNATQTEGHSQFRPQRGRGGPGGPGGPGGGRGPGGPGAPGAGAPGGGAPAAQ